MVHLAFAVIENVVSTRKINCCSDFDKLRWSQACNQPGTTTHFPMSNTFFQGGRTIFGWSTLVWKPDVRANDLSSHGCCGHRCRSRKTFGGRKIFARRVSGQIFVQIFSPTKIMKTLFWNDLKKKVFMWFCKRWAPFFSNQTPLGSIFTCIFRWFAQILRGFANIFTDFAKIFMEFALILTNENFWGVCTPPTPQVVKAEKRR